MPYNPYLCDKAGLGCDETVPQPDMCLGTFTFAGREVDSGEAGYFAGGILESNLNGIDAGPLFEAWGGGEGGLAGGAYTSSVVTGTNSGFVFAGTGVSAGPLAGSQVGLFVAPEDFGFYLEAHLGKNWAGGIGVGISSC